MGTISPEPPARNPPCKENDLSGTSELQSATRSHTAGTATAVGISANRSEGVSCRPTPARRGTRTHRLLVPLLLAAGVVLAVNSLRQDSITYDETSHLTAGMSYLLTGDFRLSPDHPPLARVWCALPLLLARQQWPPQDAPSWETAHVWSFGREWLFKYNDGERLVQIGRCMMVILYAVTCLAIYATARRLFGGGPALLALALAVFSTTMLAHGRLITTDMPVTLMFLLTLLAVSRLLRGVTMGRLLITGVSLGALSVTKFSSPLILPAVAVIGLYVVLRREPLLLSRRLSLRRAAEDSRTEGEEPSDSGTPLRDKGADSPASPYVAVDDRIARAAVLIGAGAVVLLVAWATIWTCFLWRYSSVPASHRTFELTLIQTGIWDNMLFEASGGGWSPTLWFLELAKDHKLLPEGYLYGMAYTLGTTQARPSYLMGEYSDHGWRTYFPIAFGLKTEIPLLVLLGSGIAALALRRLRPRDPLLFWTLVSFAAVYGLSAINTNLNIGHRHLLPLYPLIFIVAGGSLALVGRRWWVAMPIVLAAWLVIENASIYPHYLCYFNQFVGGPKQGHEYLADSNLDWGQDLKRLAAWVREHPDSRPVKIAYCGSANPANYGFACEMLPSTYPFASPASLTPGIYVISVNQLLGIYTPQIRDEFWADPSRRLEAPATQESALAGMLKLPKIEQLQDPTPRPLFLEQCRLINRLRHRPPDARIGYSLFVYQLDEQEIRSLLAE